ncbi:MAG: acetamidase/formamidase family protein [Acidobacteriota bacterium]
MKPLLHGLTVLGLVTATATLRADTHRFVPTAFYSTFSGDHAPALRIKSGDRVITATVDDVGVGADGRALATGQNPQTGPFYIEGAEPGDVLVVTLEKLAPNRTTGQSTSLVSPNAIAAGGLDGKPDPTRFPWTIDKAKGVVRFDLYAMAPKVDWRSRFAATEFELPLKPTLGSIGVAPAADAPAATMTGPFGGNLVTTDLATGARVMLPVYQPGALLFLGHGHARQGDGVVSGTGIETSMDVEFSVEVVKKKAWPHSSIMRASTVAGEFELGWPRIETADYIMTVGSAAALPQALQRATLEMHHWLDDDYGLSEKTVSLFVGQAIEYEIGSIAGQEATVVAKVRKSYLPRPAGALETVAN